MHKEKETHTVYSELNGMCTSVKSTTKSVLYFYFFFFCVCVGIELRHDLWFTVWGIVSLTIIVFFLYLLYSSFCCWCGVLFVIDWVATCANTHTPKRRKKKSSIRASPRSHPSLDSFSRMSCRTLLSISSIESR